MSFLQQLFKSWGFEKREILFAFAKMKLGQDMDGGFLREDLACAITVNNIAKESIGNVIGGGASTYLMYRALRFNPRFKRVAAFKKPIEKTDDILPGDIIISPTGYGNRAKISNGHVGIMGEDGNIMSNNSATGKWEQNYNLVSWYMRWTAQGDYPMRIYRIVY